MGYSVFIDGWKLPVNPEELRVSDGSRSKEYDIIGVGKVQQPEGRSLRTAEFETEFPSQVYSYVDEGAWKAPKVLVQRLRALLDDGEAFRFVAVGEADKLTMQATLESLTLKETGGEDGDYTATIKVKECPDFGAIVTAVERLPRPGKVPAVESITLKSGETALDKANVIGPSRYTGQEVLEYQALQSGKNPIQIEEYKPVYLPSTGQVEFDTSIVTSTITASDAGKALGEKIRALAEKTKKGIEDCYKNIPK